MQSGILSHQLRPEKVVHVPQDKGAEEKDEDPLKGRTRKKLDNPHRSPDKPCPHQGQNREDKHDEAPEDRRRDVHQGEEESAENPLDGPHHEGASEDRPSHGEKLPVEPDVVPSVQGADPVDPKQNLVPIDKKVVEGEEEDQKLEKERGYLLAARVQELKGPLSGLLYGLGKKILERRAQFLADLRKPTPDSSDDPFDTGNPSRKGCRKGLEEPKPFAEEHDESRSQGDKKPSHQSDQGRQRGEGRSLPGDSVEKVVEPPSRTRRHHGQKERDQEGAGHEVEKT